MNFIRRFIGPYLLVSVFVLNAICIWRLAGIVSQVDLYRSEVRRLCFDVQNIATNFLLSVDAPSSVASASSNFDLQSSTVQCGSIPYRFSVVRGVPGLSSGGLSWYPVGSNMPYGVLSSCSRDFACFNGISWYSLSNE